MKAILVTGAFGFIGRHVAKHFARAGWSVIGMGHGSWGPDEWQQWGIAEWISSDITLDALEKYVHAPDVVVHCAGSGSVGFSMEHPFQDFQSNVETTISVLDFVRLRAPRAHFVYLSSAGVYGLVEHLPISESTPLVPISPYGTHKKISEELCKLYAEHFGVTVSVLRLFSVYGAGLSKQLLWDACTKISRGEHRFYGTGNELRDWIHVDDVSSLVECVVRRQGPGYKIFNGATGQGVSVAEVLRQLFSAFGESVAPSFSGVAKPGDPKGYVAEIVTAKGLGWQPTRKLATGIVEYVQWFKGHTE